MRGKTFKSLSTERWCEFSSLSKLNFLHLQVNTSTIGLNFTALMNTSFVGKNTYIYKLVSIKSCILHWIAVSYLRCASSGRNSEGGTQRRPKRSGRSTWGGFWSGSCAAGWKTGTWSASRWRWTVRWPARPSCRRSTSTTRSGSAAPSSTSVRVNPSDKKVAALS